MIEDATIDFEDELLSEIDKGLKLSKYTIEEIRWNCKIIEYTIIDEMRWQNKIEAVVQIGKRFFLVRWYQGKTEDQANRYWAQKLQEVKEVEEIRVVKTWEPIK